MTQSDIMVKINAKNANVDRTTVKNVYTFR